MDRDVDAFYRELGRRVAARRTGLRMTQVELGSGVGASRAWVANVEAGRQKVLAHHLYALAAALRFARLDELVPAEVPEPPRGDLVGDAGVTDVQRAQIEGLLRSAVAAARPGRTAR